jgi:endonuclease G, mitochondrial
MPSKSPLDGLTPVQRILIGVALLILAGAVVAVRGCREQPQPGEPGHTLANRNVRFGMPAEATTDPANKNAYLIERPQYVLSYNDSTKNPNWVCWNLTAADIGKAERDLSFEPDPDLPKGFHRVKASDYGRSGFDRGHMCASKDRSDTPENNNILFYMTNIVPQAPKCNQQPWRILEEHCRTLAKRGNELYIACGPHGQGGTGLLDKVEVQRDSIGKTHPITVPAVVWKVVLVLPNKEAVPTRESRVIAVWVPNEQSVSNDWKQYAVSVGEVEKRTGYKFFPLVPDDVANPIKSRVDTGP